MTDTPTLVDLFFAHRGKLVDKWEQYLAIYEQELGSLAAASKPLRLLEIGVQNGGSLELWADFLPPGSTIVGLDIDPRIGELTFDNPGISVHVADATDPAAIDRALGDARFDIIIDDGSHLCRDVCATFELLFPRLEPGGRFIIEDLHCSYYPGHGGSLRGPDSSVEFLKRLVDALNADHLPEGSAPAEEVERLRAYNKTLARVSFFDSVAVVEKLQRDKDRLYRRILSGEKGDVQPFGNWIGFAPLPHLNLLLFGELAAKQFEKDAMTVIDDTRRDARAAVAEANQQVIDLTQEIDRLKIALNAQEALPASVVPEE